MKPFWCTDVDRFGSGDCDKQCDHCKTNDPTLLQALLRIEANLLDPAGGNKEKYRAALMRDAADEIDRLRKELEALEQRWSNLRWCHSGCKESASSGSSGFGFGGTDPFGLGW